MVRIHSLAPKVYAPVAQRPEQFSYKEFVGGSSPPRGTRFMKMDNEKIDEVEKALDGIVTLYDPPSGWKFVSQKSIIHYQVKC